MPKKIKAFHPIKKKTQNNAIETLWLVFKLKRRDGMKYVVRSKSNLEMRNSVMADVILTICSGPNYD